jgi:diacylglycerol kinase (ATP)
VRVALLHNSSAGSEDHTDRELVKWIRKAGHEVVQVASKVSLLLAELQRRPCDLVVVAGGDGTVSSAACELSDWQVPLAILPLGTANNTALSLGLTKRPKRLVDAWEGAPLRPFDLASFDDGSVRQLLSEALGWGIFPQAIAAAKARPVKKERGRQLRRDRALFAQASLSAEARPYDIMVDGRAHSGNYLLVEIANIPYIGPRLQLSPESNPSDGLLEVVLAGEQHRAALVELARGGVVAQDALQRVRGKHVQVTAADGVLHRDGSLVWHPAVPRRFDVRVNEGAVRYVG